MSKKMMTYIPTGVVVPFDEDKLATGLYEAWPKSESIASGAAVVADSVDAEEPKKPNRRKPKAAG